MRGPLLLLVLTAVGGGSGGGGTVEPRTAARGEPFRLPIDQTVSVTDTDLSFTFVSVERDSRCPKGVRCIRAGEAIVVLSVERSGGESSEMRFEVPPGGGAKGALGEHTVSVELEPQTVAGKRIERDAYVAVVTVSSSDA